MLKTFDEVFDDYTKYGTKIKTEQYHTIGTNIIIDQGQADIAGYTDQIDGLFKDVPVIVFGDHTRIIKYINRPFFLGADGTKILKSKIPDANYKYLYYALKNAKIPNTGYNRHFKWLKQISISYPEHEKQSMIVEILDKLEDSIDNYNTILGLLDKLVKARFIEMFGDPENNPNGWMESPLSEKLSVLGGFAFKSDKFSEISGIPILRIGNINSGHFKPVNMVYWKEDENLERYLIYPGDLVMSLTGTVGKDDYGNVCILGDDFEKYYLNQRNAKLEIQGGINKFYLSQLLKFTQVKKKLTGISRGVRQANISNKDILNLVVPIPPIELQQQFEDFVHQVDKSRFDIKKSIIELEREVVYD